MAVITPADLKAYTEFNAVQKRSDERLKKDILEATVHINRQLEYPLREHVPLPEELELAVLKVAQFCALINSDESIAKGVKSEKMGDYQYTLADGSNISFPDVSTLLNDFVKQEDEKGVTLRMRAI